MEPLLSGLRIRESLAQELVISDSVKRWLIERGRNVEHIKDYPTTNIGFTYEFPHRESDYAGSAGCKPDCE